MPGHDDKLRNTPVKFDAFVYVVSYKLNEIKKYKQLSEYSQVYRVSLSLILQLLVGGRFIKNV